MFERYTEKARPVSLEAERLLRSLLREEGADARSVRMPRPNRL